MSQYQTTPRFPRTLRAALLCASVAITPLASAAVSDPGLRVQPGASFTESIALSSVHNSDAEARLDWRTPVRDLAFTLPPADWTETLALRLSADPLRGAARDVEVRLNGGEPTLIRLDRRGFTATLDLPTGDLRAGRNTLRLALAGGEERCFTEADGGWSLDLAASRIDGTLRARSRSVFLSEVEDLLARPSTRPLKIGLNVRSDDRDTVEALLAQGLALRTDRLPELAIRSTGELSILVGTRLQLAGTVRDAALIDASGPRIGVHEGRPLRLVITGDTQEEVMAGVRAFSAHHLPRLRQRITSPGAVELSPRLGTDRRPLDRKTLVSELGGLDFSGNWGAGTDSVSFDVADPAASTARIHLDFQRADFISSDSAVSVELNDRPLGRARLDTDRVKVDFAVPQGWLRGRNNDLRVVPDLYPAQAGCVPSIDASGLVVGVRSHIRLDTAGESATGDLAKLAATGGPLAHDKGAGTHVVLPRVRGDREDALALLGQMALSAGEPLINATYGPNTHAEADLLAFGRVPTGVDAPRTLDLALAARRGTGVVAQFPENDRWVGVVAPSRGRSLSTVRTALESGAWDDLSGGITRIDRDGDTDMVQTAYAGPAYIEVPEGFAFDQLVVPEVTLPDVAELSSEVREEFGESRAILTESWREVEIRMPALVPDVVQRLRGSEPLRLRGRYDAPRVVKAPAPARAKRFTLANDTDRIGAGLFSSEQKTKFKRFKSQSARKAASLRSKWGLEKWRYKAWKWGDRNLSLMGMILMLAFSLACLGLARAEWNGR